MSDNLMKFLPWIAVAVVALIVIVVIAVNSGEPEETRDAPNMRTHTGEVIECIFTGDVLVCDFGG